MLKKLQQPFWYIWRILESKLTPDKNKECFVILGVQRSGTSIVSRIVEGCGVSFGNKKKFKKPDARNPHGFYEYSSTVRLDRKLLHQSGYRSPFVWSNDAVFRAGDLLNRLKRVIYRMQMLLFLKELAGTCGKYAFKEFPTSFYFWKKYVPHAKIIAVYRDPVANAHSLVRAFNMHTYRQSLTHWTAMNKELLYHIATHESILIKLEDLIDDKKRRSILKKLVAFIGSGDVDVLESMIVDKRDHSSLLKIKQICPLDADAREVLLALEKSKIP